MEKKPGKGSLLVIFLTVFIDLLGFGIVLPLLPIYADQFSTDERGVQLGILMASFSAMQFLFAPVWGRVSDRIGRRPVIMIGLAGSVVFYTLFGLATVWKSFSLLLFTRIGAGIAGATIATAQAYIADTTTLEKRSKGMALIGMAFGFGFTLGPLLGFAAVGKGDPGPLPGYIAAVLSAIALVLAWFQLPESRNYDQPSEAKTRLFDFGGFREAIGTRSIMPLFLASFICVFSFANFETTLSLLVKGKTGAPFEFSFGQVFLTYAFIGLVLALVQGVIVRRLAGKVPEKHLAMAGAIIQILGFGLVILGIRSANVWMLFVSFSCVTSGFALLSPSLNSLISRRTDPAKQGRILGVGQSVNSLARIFGPGIAIPLFKSGISLPYITAAGLMFGGLAMIVIAANRGGDFQASE